MEEERNNLIVKTTALVMDIVSSYINEGDFVIDCTMGNGNDTLSLAKLTGAADGADGALVYALDVQDKAIEKTTELLAENGITDLESKGIHLVNDSHVNIAKYVEAAGRQPSAIVFNLGFMPGQDKSVLTTIDTTMKAVESALENIMEDGIISVVTYCGHPEGREEHDKLIEYFAALPSKRYHVAFFDMINQKKTAPSVFFVTRKKRKKKAAAPAAQQ